MHWFKDLWVEMCAMRKLYVVIGVICLSFVGIAGGGVTVTDVTAKQRYPWNGKVDIVVTMQGEISEVANYECTFVATNSATLTAVPVTAISQVGSDAVSDNVCMLRYLWNATNDVGAVKIDDLALTVDVQKNGVQLWENGPYWAECNVGASTPDGYGYYFWWGDTVGYTRDGGTWTSDYYYSGVTWVSSTGTRMSSSPFDSSRCHTCNKDTSTLQSQGYIDSTGNLVAAHDAATVHLGAPWRMPTDVEFMALFYNCKATWTTRNGVYGRLITGKGKYASKSIFLPAAGSGSHAGLFYTGSNAYYWSSTPCSNSPYDALYLHLGSNGCGQGVDFRSVGQPVRPLRGFGSVCSVVTAKDCAITHLELDCRDGVRMTSLEGEELVFDAGWYDGDEVRITDNGAVITNGVAGSCVWRPDPSCLVNNLKLEVLAEGQVVGTESAQFSLGYVRNVTARQLWPHKKVEVCYDLTEDIGEVANADDGVVLANSAGKIASNCVGDRSCTPGRHCVVWDMEADGIASPQSSMSFSVSVADGDIGCVGQSADVELDISSEVKDGMTVGEVVELCYSPIDAESVSLEVNGSVVHTATEDGTYEWRPGRPGTYVLTHRAGTNVWTRKVVYQGTVGERELELWWLDGPVTNIFPNLDASLTDIILASSLTQIPENAFDGCAGFGPGVVVCDDCVLFVNGDCPTEVVLPVGTRLIADGAFRDCYGLASVTIPAGVRSIGAHAFANCTDLERLVIPEGVVEIGDGAFENCTWMQEVEFPTTLRRIGKRAFANCASLPSIECRMGLESIGECAFSNCWRMLSVSLPLSVDEIGTGAFSKCKNILGVTVPAHVDTIARMFPEVYNSKLEAVVIAEGETEMVPGFLKGCSLLEELELPEALEEIPDSAFEGCSGLLGIEFPEGLSRIGNRAFYGCGQIVELEFPDGLEEIGDDAFNGLPQVLDIVCPESVRSIGERAFKGVWNDEVIKLPMRLETIGKDAFADCGAIRRVELAPVAAIKTVFPSAYSKITAVKIRGVPGEIARGFGQRLSLVEDISIPDSVTNICSAAFADMTKLAGLKLPPELEAIGENAFSGCSALTEMVIPQSVTLVGANAFYGCSSIRKVGCPGEICTMQTLFPSAYSEIASVSINEGTTWLRDDLLSGCVKVAEVDLPAGITNIGARAFKDCRALTSFGVPQGVVAMGSDVFSGCTGLTALSLPEGLTRIPSGAFGGCSALTAMVIPSSVKYIEANAFNGCSALTEVVIPQSVTSVGANAFYGCSSIRKVGCPGEIYTMQTLFPSAYSEIASVSINEGTTWLRDDLLSGCVKVAEVDLPAGITNIGARAFKDCRALTSFGVPQGVVAMGSDVFSGCTGLTALSLPEGLTRIPSGAFRDCSALTALVIPSSVKYIEANAFNGCSALKSISYLGAAPGYDAACYNGTAADMWSYVIYGSRGWDGVATSRSLPEYWPTSNQRNIDYWKPNALVATFDANGGSPASTSIVQTTGMTYVLPDCEPTMTGASFNGWWTEALNGGQIKPTTKVVATGDQTYYAHWKYNTYFVRFDANGGSGDMEDQTLTVNSPEGLYAGSFQRKGYQLVGWSRTTGGGMAYADGEQVMNLALEQDAVVTLYAVWTAKSWSADDYMNAPGRAFETSGDCDWVADDATSHDGVGSMRSGAIAAAGKGRRETSVLETSVYGEGVGSFWWKADCDPSEGGAYQGGCEFRIDGVVITNIAGKVDWERIEYEVPRAGAHTLQWVFARGDSEDEGTEYENAAWVDEFIWMSIAGPTDPIPELESPSTEAIESVLVRANDVKLSESITNETEYVAFREWSGVVKEQGGEAVGAAGVMASPNAWVSYALGSEVLLEAAPTDADLTVEEFEPTSDATKAGQFDFTVSVEGVEVGGAATTAAQQEKVKENLKQVFGLEGGTSLEDGGMSADNVEIEFGTPVDGKVKFTAGPNAKNADAKTFFMKVKVNQ